MDAENKEQQEALLKKLKEALEATKYFCHPKVAIRDDYRREFERWAKHFKRDIRRIEAGKAWVKPDWLHVSQEDALHIFHDHMDTIMEVHHAMHDQAFIDALYNRFVDTSEAIKFFVERDHLLKAETKMALGHILRGNTLTLQKVDANLTKYCAYLDNHATTLEFIVSFYLYTDCDTQSTLNIFPRLFSFTPVKNHLDFLNALVELAQPYIDAEATRSLEEVFVPLPLPMPSKPPTLQFSSEGVGIPAVQRERQDPPDDPDQASECCDDWLSRITRRFWV